MIKLPKIIKKLMNNGVDIDQLMSLKNNFQGNSFQWIKTQDRSVLGKVVRVVDIDPGARGRFIATLSDGNRIDTDQLSNNLMMLHDDQPQMSMSEIQSLNYIPSLADANENSNLPPEVRESLTQAAPVVQASQPSATAQPASTVQRQPADPGDLFGMFALEETDLQLAVSVRLPAKSLLKMMYSNSQDKDKFLSQLAAYINNSVTADSVKESLSKILAGQEKKKKSDAVTST